jgi:hypothetical protein
VPVSASVIRAFRKAWTEAGWQREPRVSVSRSIFVLTAELDHAYFGRDAESIDQVGYLDADTRAIFGPGSAPGTRAEHGGYAEYELPCARPHGFPPLSYAVPAVVGACVTL